MTDEAIVTDTETELALAGIAASLIDDIVVARSLELAAGLAPAPAKRDWRSLGPRARGMAESAGMPREGATPDRPGAHFCDICGCADQDQIEPGPDKDTFGADKCAWMCKDANARACEARKLHRYPPRPDLVPEAFLSALDADDAARLSRQQPAPQEEQPAAQEPAQPGNEVPVSQNASYSGWYDKFGSWHAPALPQFDAYSHTLQHPANRSHLLSGQARPHYYAGANYIPPGILSGAEGGQQLPGGTVPPAGGQAPQNGGQVPQGAPGPVRGQEGGDVAMGQPAHPAALPARPGQQWQTPVQGPQLRRRKLRYSAGRKTAVRKHPQAQPESPGWGGSGDGPDGASSSAEV